MLCIWSDMNIFIKKDITNKRNEIIFNNRCIAKKGKPFFHETLFLKNIFKLHHITDGQGALKSDYFFRCMGLNEEEVSVIKEIFEHTPREWKYDLRRHTSVDGLNIEFVFHEKKSNSTQ